MVRLPGLEPGPDPWQGSIIAPRQQTRENNPTLRALKSFPNVSIIMNYLKSHIHLAGNLYAGKKLNQAELEWK